MFTVFNAQSFRLDQPAKFIYNSKLRTGIVKEIGKEHIKLEHTNEDKTVVTKTFNYHKMQPVSE